MFASNNRARLATLLACFAVVACGDDGSGAGGTGAAGGSGGGASTGGSPSSGGEGGEGGVPGEGGAGATNKGGEGGMPATGGGGGAAGGEGGEGGEGGGEPQMVFSCNPAQGDYVGDDCGLFVDPTVAPGTGLGTKLSPVASVAEAVALLGDTRRIYVCAGLLFEELELPPQLALHGGLSCTESWRWQLNARTSVVSEPDTVPLTIVGAPGTTNLVTGCTFGASDVTMASSSSISAIVSQATVRFERTGFSSGNAANGADGAPGAPGFAGSNGVNATDTVEGAGGVSGCGSTGGAGGFVSQLDPQNVYGNGQPGAPSQNNGGARGSLAPPPIGNCQNGGPGVDRGDSTALGGLPGFGLGTISATGFVGTASLDGLNGAHGGGGGGGGAKPHQPGGGGGGGGCGGGKGRAGRYGGSSIALISIDSDIVIADSQFSVGQAGAGGAGGLGGLGGAGGLGGMGDVLGCDGGAGGRGQRGGAGSAGPGGHQIAIAYKGSLPMLVNTILPEPGEPGFGAPVGVAAQTLQFP